MSGNSDSRHTPPPPRRSQAERTTATRGALLRAGRALFAEKGYAGAGREEIVALAGVTRGALYHHFGDKLGLFRAVVEEFEAEITAQVAAAADSAGGDPRQGLIVGSLHFLDASMDPAARRIVLDAPAALGWREWREIQESHGLGLTKLALMMAMESGAIERQPVDPLAHMLLAALNEAATLVAQSDDPATTRAQVGETVEYLLNRL
jgi:AcrR family transcriptional regulator